MVITMDTITCHWELYFQGSGLPLSLCRTWSGYLYSIHIAFQKPHAVGLVLHTMTFCLSGNAVALHLDNSTAKT